tara:strand:- start:37729 stop:38028 length:300 start_codon:yes stop_codon:yes gene_type:complete
MERDKIKLSNSQWRDLVQEEYLDMGNSEIEIKIMDREYESSGRHKERHNLVFQRLDNNKFYRVVYEESVKDSMGWSECNEGDTEAVEVFQKEVKIFKYE